MDIIFFVFSLVVVIYFAVKVVSVIAGHSINVPMPILHLADIDFANTYISTPAMIYQVYFWSMYAGIFN